jgi:Tfp pilus assembly protein PilF
MDDYPRALIYFERSMAIYGRDTGTLYNIAACHHLLGEPGEAAAALHEVLAHDPGNQPARNLLADCESAAAKIAPALASNPG